MAIAVYGSVKLGTEEGYGSVWHCTASYIRWLIPCMAVTGDGYGSVWLCKSSNKVWLWQCMALVS